jgi:hypothetical protein
MATYGRAWRAAKRLYPLAREAWRRWDDLSDAEKERYKRQAKRYTNEAARLARDAASRTPLPGRGQGGSRKRRR